MALLDAGELIAPWGPGLSHHSQISIHKHLRCDDVVPVCHYPLFEGQEYSAIERGVTHTFATEVEMLNFVGSRRIGLYAPQPLNDAQWESYARG